MAKKQVIEREGRFWFTSRYAAKLLGTSPRKVEMLWLREHLQGFEEAGTLWIAETSVTEHRRSGTALRKLLDATKIEQALKRPEIGSIVPRLGSQARADQHVLPIADFRQPLDRKPRLKD